VLHILEMTIERTTIFPRPLRTYIHITMIFRRCRQEARTSNEVSYQLMPGVLIMYAKSMIAGLFAAVTAAGAFANDQFNGEAYNELPHASSASTVSRADVKAEVVRAQSAGEIAYGDAGYKVPVAQSTKTRAEVLADLQIWRESGLAALEGNGDGKTSFVDPRWAAAHARYDQLRASPRYAALVQKFAGRHGQVDGSAS
jgi:hypothetical protein